ncbi:MAG TPA: benzoate-CoA ligase family protein [Candidatus Binataceae bacterium]|nr:benzoate-CoA ligase family protein [Candidatus Binataceae bacterium]
MAQTRKAISLAELTGEGLEQTRACWAQLPAQYNAASHFIDRHLNEGRGAKIAFIDDRGPHSYAALAARVNRAGNVLRSLGVRMEERVMLCLHDSVDFIALFWGAVKIGAVPVPVNTLLKPADYDFMLRDSRARVLAISADVVERVEPLLANHAGLQAVLICGSGDGAVRGRDFEALSAQAAAELTPAPTKPSDTLYWLYTSGTTGAPKGVIHRHADILHSAQLLGEKTLGIGPDDVIFSASKLAFSYGLCCANAFPLHAGASAVLMAGAPSVDNVASVIARHRPTIFCSVPTLYARLLGHPIASQPMAGQRLRFCLSAGEPLPEAIARRWKEQVGVEILDCIGTTETLLMFICNRPDDVRYGSSGKPIAGCEARLLTAEGAEVEAGEVGDLWVYSPSTAAGYWNNPGLSARTFVGGWSRTGDKYWRDPQGYYRYAGRADDMLKVGGIWVSPFEVEATLSAHPEVLEAAVVGALDDDGLTKAKAFVVLKKPAAASPAQAEALREFVKSRLAPFKCPRWVEFLPELPKTATGKIQRFKLRQD